MVFLKKVITTISLLIIIGGTNIFAQNIQDIIDAFKESYEMETR